MSAQTLVVTSRAEQGRVKVLALKAKEGLILFLIAVLFPAIPDSSEYKPLTSLQNASVS